MKYGAFKAVRLAEEREGKNTYTQSENRVKVFDGYSDCSSLWWKCYEKAYGIEIGTWTGEQVENGKQISCYYGKSNLSWEDYEKLQIGDLIFFGEGQARHVEGFVGWKNGTPLLFGHGSGTPSYKNGLLYSHSAGFYQARRYYTETEEESPEDKKKTKLFIGRVTVSVLSVRTWAGTEYEMIHSCPELKRGELVDVLNFTQKDQYGQEWYYIKIHQKYYGFACSKYIEKAGE